MNYQEFLKEKAKTFEGVGFTPQSLNSHLKPFQAEIVIRACTKGRFALFEECGMGKSLQELEWARLVVEETNKPVLLVCPLAVSSQFLQEAEKFEIPNVKRVNSQDDVETGINVTNYEKLHHFSPETFGGLVLDESSILKGFSGKIRKQITEFAEPINFRLAGTATPSPNDLVELTNHAEFLGVMTGKEIIASFFVQDGNTTHKWRLRHHAHKPFFKWLASWAVAIRTPTDIGFDDSGYDLPALNRHQITVCPDIKLNENELFASEAQTLSERQKIRRQSIRDRVSEAAKLVNNSEDKWICWCDLNDESSALTKSIPDAVEVTGSMSNQAKEEKLKGFTNGDYRVLVSKPSLAGFGLNWQHCHNMVFVGLSDSFEQQYQAIRRCWRFGQEKEVNVYHVVAEQEGAVVRNIQRKQKQHTNLMENLTRYVSDEFGHLSRKTISPNSDCYQDGDFTLYLGDCIDEIDNLEDDSVGLSVFSPPFPGMYAYTDSEHDMGNTDGMPEMIEHFRYLVKPDKLMRVMKPGRRVCVHLTQLTSMKSREGVIGLKDYRGEVIRLFQQEGWIFSGEVTIEKDPQLQAIRNKERGLMFKTLSSDSAMMRMALADYIVYFTKPGENKEPIKAGASQKYNNPDGWITQEEWIDWASPIWKRATPDYPQGIRETNVLNTKIAKEGNDERHMCPMQLDAIARCVKLWSNPNDVVFSPFAGIGSEGYKALELNRKFVGIELKDSYYKTAISNLDYMQREKGAQRSIFELLEHTA